MNQVREGAVHHKADRRVRQSELKDLSDSALCEACKDFLVVGNGFGLLVWNEDIDQFLKISQRQ